MEAQAKPILAEDFDGEQQAMGEQWAALGSRAARRGASVTAAVVAVFLVATLLTRSTPSPLPRVALQAQVGLDEADDDPCNAMPFLRIMSVVSNNLGGKGPETEKPEGIVYEAEAHNSGLNNSNDLQIHINAVSEDYFGHGAEEGTNTSDANYQPEWPKVNGITGNFGTINIHPGTNVTVKLTGYDATKGERIVLPKMAMTFFDLDTGKDGIHSVEFLKINNFRNYYVSNETELEIRQEGDGATKFTATVEGTGNDNPETPLILNVLQKNRAVSFVFEGQEEVVFQVGASDGEAARVFQFVVRPIMRCCYTKMPDGTLLAADDPNSPIAIVAGNSQHARLSSVLLLGLALATSRYWL